MSKSSFLTPIFLAILLALAGTAQASHFRGASIVPSVDASGLLTITIDSFWRPTSVDLAAPTVVPACSGLIETSNTLNTTDSRFTKRTQVFTCTLAGSATYTVSWGSCCRVAGINNAGSSSWDMESTIVWDGSTANSPIFFNLSSVQPEVVRGIDYTGNLGAVPGFGLTLTYNQNLNTGITSQPPGFTIDTSTGAMFIPAADTATYSDNAVGEAGADYAFSGNILASDGSSVEFDWLFDAVDTGGNLAPTVDDSTVTVLLGTVANHTFTGSDPNSDPLTWSLLAFLGPSGVAPVFDPSTQLFTWDTTGSPLGTYVALVEASDGLLTDVGQLTINVIQPEADLGITKTDAPDPVVAGTTLTYTLTVSNKGPDDAGNVVVTDTLPAGVSLVQTTGCAEDPAGVPSCSLGTVPAMTSKQTTITVAIDPATRGTITNQAGVASTTVDPNPLDDSTSESTTVVGEADLAITKVADMDPVIPGGTLTYTLEVTNSGPSDAQNVEVMDTLPPTASLVSTVGCAEDPMGVPTCSLGTIPAMTSKLYLLTVVIDRSAKLAILNQASVTSTDTDPNPANSSTSLGIAVSRLSIAEVPTLNELGLALLAALLVLLAVLRLRRRQSS